MIASKYLDQNDFCQYHRQNGHDTKKCYSLKHKTQDLIDSNALSIDNLDGSGNKFVSPPSQNLQIYMNPLPMHDNNTIAQPSTMEIVYDSKMDNLNHVVNQVKHVGQYVSPPPPQSQPQIQPQVQSQPRPKPKPKLKTQPKPRQQHKNKRPRELLLTFDDSETIKAPNGPLYIYARISHKPPRGCLVDPTSLVNFITEENLFMKILQCDSYDISDVWIQTCNGFLYPSFGSITLSVELYGKIVNTTFVVVPTSDQFQVKLGFPWLNAIHDVASPIHKFLKFIHVKEVKTVNHSIYQPSRPRDCVALDLFWPSLPNSCPSQPD